MMMGFGLLTMLFFIALPLVLIAGLVILLVGIGRSRAVSIPPTSQSVPGVSSVAPSAEHVCSHCGTRLQPEWEHCPQCGAPVQDK